MNLRLILIAVFFFLIIQNIFACNDGQIDVNSASMEELDLLYGIGIAKAQAIINSRPFNSVDDLIKVSGIGEVTLQKIKDQGFACVNESAIVKNVEDDKPEKEYVEEEPKKDLVNDKINEEFAELQDIDIEPELIVLESPKTIKSVENSEESGLSKSDYAKSGFIIFCIFIGGLMLFKKGKHKNEFK